MESSTRKNGTWSLGKTELLLVSGGVCEGVSWRNWVWRARSNVHFCSHAPLALGTAGRGFRTPFITVIGPADMRVPRERESGEFAVWGLAWSNDCRYLK